MPVTDVRNNVKNNYSFISAFIQDMTLFVWVTGRASYPNIGMVMICIEFVGIRVQAVTINTTSPLL